MKGVGTVVSNLNAWYDRVLAGAYMLAQRYAAEGEAMAKRDAVWTDRTAHARQRLRGSAFRESTRIGFRVSHGVGYGVYLELAMSGKYAVLKPTVDSLAPDFVDDVKRVAGLR